MTFAAVPASSQGVAFDGGTVQIRKCRQVGAGTPSAGCTSHYMGHSSLFADEVMERLRERHPRFHETSYLFVISALHRVLELLGHARHISGRELAEGVRDLAIERYGPMARTVLEHWGIESTSDVGRIVFALVEAGILIKQDEDSPDDFDAVYDFDEVFDENYPWGANV